MDKKDSGKRASKKDLRGIQFTTRLDGAAGTVILTGDFTAWSPEGIELVKRANGAWAAQLQLPPGEYQYRLRVDGEWKDHPEASRRTPNAFGTENCVLVVKG